MKKKWNSALAYYQNPLTAEAVLNKLFSKGFKRSASVQYIGEGEYLVHQYHPSILLASVILAFLVAIITTLLILPQWLSIGLPLLLLIGIGYSAWLLYAHRRY